MAAGGHDLVAQLLDKLRMLLEMEADLFAALSKLLVAIANQAPTGDQFLTMPKSVAFVTDAIGSSCEFALRTACNFSSYNLP